MLRYKALKTINIRRTPAVIDGVNSNDIGDILANTEFLGSALVDGANGVKYIELVSVGGVDKTGFVSTLAAIQFIEDTGTTNPPPVTVGFPQSYILTDNDPKSPNYGKRAEYTFSKVL